MEIVDLSKILTNSKVGINEKVKSLKQLQDIKLESRSKDQFVIDWVCGSLDYISKTESLVQVNTNAINNLLECLNRELNKNLNSKSRCFLKSNFVEVLVKFFKYDDYIDPKHVINCLYSILQEESWRYSLILKFNILVDAFEHACVLLWSSSKVDKDICLKVSCLLAELYLKQVKLQFNMKKIYKQFCKQLLIKIMCTRSYCCNLGTNNVEKLMKTIDDIVMVIFNEKQHIVNLKATLQTPEIETPIKKQKVEHYTGILFDEIKCCQGEMQDFFLPSAYVILDHLVLASRSTGRILSQLDEFQVLVHLIDLLNLKELMKEKKKQLLVLNTLHELFNVAVNQDLYPSVEDKNQNNKYFNWMKDLYNAMATIYSQSESNVKKTIADTFLLLLNMNHLVLEESLHFLWCICLQSEGSSDTISSKESLLCGLLHTYNRLHQLDKFVGQLSVMGMNNHRTIEFPSQFVKRYSVMVSSLPNKQINALLELYRSKYKELCLEATDLSLSKLEQLTYVAWYLVLLHASVIPEQGYMTEELLRTIEILKKLDGEIKEQVTNGRIVKKRQRGRLTCIHNMVQLATNKFCLLLKEFKFEDEVNGLFDTKCINEQLPNKYQHNYLQLSFCIEKFRIEGNVEEWLSTSTSLINELNENQMESDEEWNLQFFCISEKTHEDALYKLFRHNILMFLNHNHHVAIDWFVKRSWVSNPIDASSRLCLELYNNMYFQNAIVSEINQSIQQAFLQDEPSINVKKFRTDYESADNKTDVVMEICEEFKACSKLKEKCLPQVAVVLQKLHQLPLDYLTPDNLLILSLLLIKIQHCLTKKHRSLCKESFVLITKICDAILHHPPSQCHLPLAYMFKANVDYFSETDVVDDVQITKGFACIAKALIITSKETGEIVAICEKIILCLKSDKTLKLSLALCRDILSIVVQIVMNPVIKSRRNKMAYTCALHLSEPLVALFHCTEHTPELVGIYTNLCKIVNQSLLKQKKPRILEPLEDRLVGVFENLEPLLWKDLSKTDLDTTADVRNDVQYKYILEVVYQTGSEFTLRLRALLQQTESNLVLCLLKKMECASDAELFYSNLVTSIVLQVDEIKLSSLLKVLTDNLAGLMRASFCKAPLIVWKTLLLAKWNKEQRIVLWNFLPKVMVTCVQLLTNVEDFSDLQLILQVLINCINIAKRSLMSQYVSCVYQTFTIATEFIKNQKFQRFVTYFGLMFELASQLLFNHQSAVYTSLPSYLQSVYCLMESLVLFARENPHAKKETEDLSLCCQKMSRLYREIGSHKTVITKYSPYIIADYVRACQFAMFGTKHKNVMDSGIYCVIDTCTDFEFSLLATVLDKADKEHFRRIRENYEKHHKFTGKT